MGGGSWGLIVPRNCFLQPGHRHGSFFSAPSIASSRAASLVQSSNLADDSVRRNEVARRDCVVGPGGDVQRITPALAPAPDRFLRTQVAFPHHPLDEADGGRTDEAAAHPEIPPDGGLLLEHWRRLGLGNAGPRPLRGGDYMGVPSDGGGESSPT